MYYTFVPPIIVAPNLPIPNILCFDLPFQFPNHDSPQNWQCWIIDFKDLVMHFDWLLPLSWDLTVPASRDRKSRSSCQDQVCSDFEHISLQLVPKSTRLCLAKQFEMPSSVHQTGVFMILQVMALKKLSIPKNDSAENYLFLDLENNKPCECIGANILDQM